MHDRFLRACRREPTDVTPVWFMRQAGRYMAEYRALRQKYTLLDICRTPELALEVTLQPLRMGMDAAILFADILLPLEPMGAPFEFAKGEGPVIHAPVRDRGAIERLRVFEPEEGLGHVLQAVRLIRRELDGKTPLIGFAGAPFTIASYLIEGGKSSDYRLTKQLMWSDPESWTLLMGKISEVVRLFLRAQVEAGAQAVQLFDSWVGSLSIQDYREHVAPHVRYILRDLETTGVPVIHFGTNTASLLEEQRDAGGTVIGVDWRTPLSQAWQRVGHDRAVQGNLDPLLLCAPREVAERRARAVLAEAAGRPGHIFNLGHGIIPETPVDNVKAMVDLVHSIPTAELHAAGGAPA
ncbi:uroporphyrinogen decarboxylase [Chondromyces apiculatus]|uniref:Uroporphyrinogen decarboxylase n=1 Tax=Chondromyces apiculatus DSM 436 TaxID=1192034 RepID=A0A017SZZ5_9BACT|nr:uroporphyrinogen decarboxylase [Chondromyces apiculatus]EYF02342.1 Uroporphyrinogen III decarboxylase [Chondromyces apiculatus DSM 436]